MAENLKRFDPIQHYDMGGSGYGEMKECLDGDYVRTDEAQAEIDRLKLENERLRVALRSINRAPVGLGAFGGHATAAAALKQDAE